MSGEFSIYREDSAGTRTLAAGPWTLSVNAGQGTNVSVPEPPSNTYRLVVAFRGQIGAEGSVSSGFYAVAGKVYDYTRPPVPCGAGSSGVFSVQGPFDGTGLNDGAPGTGTRPEFNPGTWELGSTPGQTQVEIDLGYLPDSVVIRRGSATGPVIYTTNGFVTGPRFLTINNPGGFDPSQTRIHVRIEATNSGWNIQASCPGVGLNNDNRPFDVIYVSFSVTQTSGFCNPGYVDFFFDQAPAGRAYLNNGATNGMQVFTGPHHVRAVTTLTGNTFGCGGIITPRYHDRAGVHAFTSTGANVIIQ